MKTANETIITCVQIESAQAVNNVHAICAVRGIGVFHTPLLSFFLLTLDSDMVFIGPNDLALSLLGYVPAKGDEPEFIEAINTIVAAARKHGKWVGRLSNTGALCKEHLETFDTVALSYDIRALQDWCRTELKIARDGRKVC